MSWHDYNHHNLKIFLQKEIIKWEFKNNQFYKCIPQSPYIIIKIILNLGLWQFICLFDCLDQWVAGGIHCLDECLSSSWQAPGHHPPEGQEYLTSIILFNLMILAEIPWSDDAGWDRQWLWLLIYSLPGSSWPGPCPPHPEPPSSRDLS